MSDKIENPPAFPGARNGSGKPYEEGMTLRDYFAAKILNGLVTNVAMGAELERRFDADRKIADAGEKNESPHKYLCRLTYAMADAMLAERSKERK